MSNLSQPRGQGNAMPNNGPSAMERNSFIPPNSGTGGVAFHQNFSGPSNPNIFIFQHPGQYSINLNGGLASGINTGIRAPQVAPRSRFFPFQELATVTDANASTGGAPWATGGGRPVGSVGADGTLNSSKSLTPM